MAISVKDAGVAAQKYVTRAQAAGPDYGAGVANAGGKWAANTKASSDAWAAGVSQAAAQDRFGKGVNATSQSKYQVRATTVGVQRYPQGVQGAKDTWQQATAPFLDVIKNLNLAPRQPKGNPANYQRVQQVGDALRAKRLGTNT